MKSHKRSIIFALVLSLSSCGTPKYATAPNTPDLSRYKYVYVQPTSEKTSISEGLFGESSVNPANIVAGRFIKEGFISVPTIDDGHRQQTIIVQTVETDRTLMSVEMTLQLLDAATYDLICNISRTGIGDNATGSVRIAINKCLKAIFN